MKAYKVYEMIGAGYSTSYRSAPRIGGSSKNFGLGGMASPYIYSILPLNKSLEPPVSSPVEGTHIIMGSKIKGFALNNNKEYVGNIIEIKKNAEGEILYYRIKITKTNSAIKIDPTNVSLYYDEFDALNKNTYINHIKQQKGEF